MSFVNAGSTPAEYLMACFERRGGKWGEDNSVWILSEGEREGGDKGKKKSRNLDTPCEVFPCCTNFLSIVGVGRQNFQMSGNSTFPFFHSGDVVGIKRLIFTRHW